MNLRKRVFFNNRVVAERVASLIQRQSALLDDSILQVQRECSEEEFELYREAVAKIMGYMFDLILDPLWSANPELAPESLGDLYERKS